MFAYMMRLAYVEEEETLMMSRIIRCTSNWCSAFNSSGGNNGRWQTPDISQCRGQGHWLEDQLSVCVVMVGETGVPGESLHKHGENMQTHRQADILLIADQVSN